MIADLLRARAATAPVAIVPTADARRPVTLAGRGRGGAHRAAN